MSEIPASSEVHDEPALYEIRIRGYLEDGWGDWFGGLTVAREANGDTRLTGSVVDQAALHGLLRKVRDLGILLLSVRRVEPGPSAALATDQAEAPDVKQ
jgi:hypothetical protein